MNKYDSYLRQLEALSNWEPFLIQESGLPGPRGNLELARAAADHGSPVQFERWLALDPLQAPENTPLCFLSFCGVEGLGRLAAGGDKAALLRLRAFAGDPRWRIREAAAIALQRVGKVNMSLLLDEMERWCDGTWLEKRAAAAALAEPVLLGHPATTRRALLVLDRITASIVIANDRSGEEFKVLRQALGYCWSVITAALPEAGMPLMEHWMRSPDKDIRWIMKENLNKKRLAKMDPIWVEDWKKALE